MGEPLEGWLVASKRLGPLHRIKRGALGRDCGREGSGALPLPRAAAISTRLRVLLAPRPHMHRAYPPLRQAISLRCWGLLGDRGGGSGRGRGRGRLRVSDVRDELCSARLARLAWVRVRVMVRGSGR